MLNSKMLKGVGSSLVATFGFSVSQGLVGSAEKLGGYRLPEKLFNFNEQELQISKELNNLFQDINGNFHEIYGEVSCFVDKINEHSMNNYIGESLTSDALPDSYMFDMPDMYNKVKEVGAKNLSLSDLIKASDLSSGENIKRLEGKKEKLSKDLEGILSLKSKYEGEIRDLEEKVASGELSDEELKKTEEKIKLAKSKRVHSMGVANRCYGEIQMADDCLRCAKFVKNETSSLFILKVVLPLLLFFISVTSLSLYLFHKYNVKKIEKEEKEENKNKVKNVLEDSNQSVNLLVSSSSN